MCVWGGGGGGSLACVCMVMCRHVTMSLDPMAYGPCRSVGFKGLGAPMTWWQKTIDSLQRHASSS